jgi:small neutral amino acid transporter SnatA (MarC family)
MSHDFISSVLLLLMLLNPFLLIIYLLDLVQDLEAGEFSRVLFRAGVISSLVFSAFALLGDVIFEDLLQARFASFQVPTRNA